MYKFSHFPTPVPLDEYMHQQAVCICMLKELFGSKLVSIYRIGEMGLEGVSDIDLLVVYRGEDHKKVISQNIGSLPLIDMPLLILETDVHNLALYTHHVDFEYLYGKKLDTMEQELPREYLLIYTWKILFMSLLRNFYPVIFSKSIPVKQLLSHIYDIRYPILFLGRISSSNMSKYMDFLDRYSVFRKNWYSNPDTSVLVAFLQEAIDLSWELIYLFTDSMPSVGVSISHVLGGRYPTIFLELPKEKYRALTERYYATISKRDRFLVMPRQFDSEHWPIVYQAILHNLLKVNPGFLRTSFSSITLRLALKIKKVVDFIKISWFMLYEKN